eukprot:2457155-Rhodomonas_salina.1
MLQPRLERNKLRWSQPDLQVKPLPPITSISITRVPQSSRVQEQNLSKLDKSTQAFALARWHHVSSKSQTTRDSDNEMRLATRVPGYRRACPQQA